MSSRSEVLRITGSMTVACALGALILGGLYVLTERYQREASRRGEMRAIGELLGLEAGASVLEVRQYLAPDRAAVIYETRALGEERSHGRAIAFTLDGRPLSSPASSASPGVVPLGRLFVARVNGAPAGFVVEGVARGYKNRIRFLIGLSNAYEITGVRVVEHEEDPGLGAEVATREFQGQFLSRPASQVEVLDVTRDPMPEDWRAALAQLQRTPTAIWRERNRTLIERERGRKIYAVTGATISSRALTDGVRATVDHFRRRWTLLAPYLRGVS